MIVVVESIHRICTGAGRNGVGKTTLLKHMANFSIEGFPTHHRVLHVRQEVMPSNDSVRSAVLKSDVERTQLLQFEHELLQKQQDLASIGDAASLADIEAVEKTLADVYCRMEQIGAKTAESRVAEILSGLQFDETMMDASTASLSGGWRMRVSLAAALFIEP